MFIILQVGRDGIIKKKNNLQLLFLSPYAQTISAISVPFESFQAALAKINTTRRVGLV